MDLTTAGVESSHNHNIRAESREPRAESREPRAESREPRAESREPRAESREPRAELRPRLRGSESVTRSRVPSSRRAASAWRRLALLPALLPVLALLLGMFSPFAAAPASADVLVSTVGQTAAAGGGRVWANRWHAQAFTTGSNTAGYTLTSIEARTNQSEAAPSELRAQLWSDVTGNPGVKLADLTVPATISASGATPANIVFAAPAGTRLAANTTYYFVIGGAASRSPATNMQFQILNTASDSEDSGAAAGWSVDDTSRFATGNNGNPPSSWSTWTETRLIRVNGSARGAALSTNANLSALAAKSATSGTGTFSALALSPATFAKATLAYTASVANSITHVKLTPTVEATGKATVKVGKGTSLTAVGSGTESTAIALSEGANAIKVEVTAEDGTTKRTYTVTVTRAASTATAPWSATLTPASGNNVIGCTSKTDCDTRLTDNSFTVGGTAYHFTEIAASSGLGLGVSFNAAPNAALRALKFCVGTTGYSIGIAPSQILTSTNPGWTAGTPVSLKIAASCAAATTPQVSFASTTYSVNEGASVTLTVNISPALTTASRVAVLATTPSSSNNPEDYTFSGLTGRAGSRMLALPANATTATFTLAAVADGTTEGAETATWFLQKVTGEPYTVVRASEKTTITIADTSTAAPASANALVSNLGQTTFTPTVTVGSNPVAQKFTTGSATAGYTLASLEIDFAAAVGTPANLRAELWSATGAGAPDSKLASLTVPSTVGAGAVAFAAPSNTSLAASTSYFVVVYRSGATTGSLRTTRTNNEDSGSASGWSIGDTRHGRAGTAWRTNSVELKIRVNGAVKGATQSTNSELSGLTVKSAASAAGTFSALALTPSTFSATTTSYTASVANSITHVKLTPTKAHTGASIKVGKGTSLTAVTSGTETSAIALSEGANAIKVEVTAEDGTTKRTYTVTVTRAASGTTPPAATPTVSLSVDQSNVVAEGSSATIVATLSAALGSDVVIPVTVTRGSAEAGDIGTLTSITVAQGFTVGAADITTAQDTDADHETFTVSLGTPLPSSVSAGTPNSVTVTVQDDEATRDSLVGLSLTVGGSAVTLSPAFKTSTTSYTGTVAVSATSASVTPTWIEGHNVETTVASATPDFDSILTQQGSALASSGTSKTVTLAASGATWVSVTVSDDTAETSTTYRVVLNKLAAPSAAPTGLDVTGGDGKLDLSWTAPSGTVSGYTVQYRRSDASSLSVTGDPDTGYADAGHSGTGTTAAITGLTNGVAYTVRVQAVNAGGGGPWATGTGTPVAATTAPTALTLEAGARPGEGGAGVFITARLNAAAPTGGTAVTLSVGSASTATGSGAGADYTLSATTLTIAAGQTSGRVTLTIVDDAVEESDETLVLSAASTNPVLTSNTLTLSIQDNDATTPAVSLSAAPNPVAEGSPVTVTATLSEALAGTVSIPVTVSLGSAESGDIGTLASIAIAAGSTTGTGTITTAQDDGTDDETFTVSLGTLPSSVSAGTPNSVTVRIADDDAPGRVPADAGPSAGLVLSVATGDGSLALTWNKLWGPNHSYEVQWKVSPAPDADATTPGDPSTGWVAPGRARVVNGVPQTVYATGTAYTIGGLANGTAYDVRVRPLAYPHETPVRWSTGAGTPRAPAPPAALTLGVDPVALAHGGAVTVTARLDAPAKKAMEVWFDTAGDGGAARWGPDCAWEHGTGALFAAGEREATVKLCATAAGAGRTMTVTAGTYDPALTAAAVRVRVQGPNPPTALVVEADPQAVAAGGTVTVTARLDRPSAPGMTVHLHLNGIGAASWGACGGTAAARTLPSPLAGLATVEIPPGGREATAELCVLWEAGPRLELGAYAYAHAPRLDAPNLALPGPGGLGLRALTVASPDPAQRVAQGEVALEAQSSSYEVRVPLAVDRVTVKPAVKYASAAAKVNGKPVDAGTPAVEVALKEGENPVIIEVSVPKVAAVRKYTLTVVRSDAAKEPETQVVARPACEAGAGPLCGLALTAGSGAVALSPAFAPGVTFYRASVPAGTAGVTLAPRWSGEASVFAGSRWGAATFTRPARVRPSGTALDLALAPDGGTTELWVMAVGSSGRKTYRIDVTGAPAAVAVSLSATPNPVAEGSPVTVTAVLAKALAADVAIPLTVTRGTSEDGDHGTLASVTVPAGFTSASGTIATGDDADGDDETFTVALGSLPSGLSAGASSSVEVTITDDGAQQQQASSDATLSALTGSTSGDGASFGDALALSPAFSPATASYSASVPHGATHARLTPTANDAGAAVRAGRGTSLSAVAAGGSSGAIALAVGDNALAVEVTAADGTVRTYAVTVARAGPPLTAAFEGAPPEHDGSGAFWLKVRFSEALGEGAVAPVPASFKVRAGQARKVERIEAGLWRVKVKPDAWRDVTVTLADGRGCAEEGAVCAAGGRALANAPVAKIGGPVRVRVADARAKEGKDASLDFAVTLSRAASGAVSVDYATADGTATAGEDYTATSGTLTFAPGETARTVRVAILDDAIDEGKETFVLRLSNPQGAYLRGIHREAKGVIANDDPMPGAWLARFGRTAAENVVEAVGARIEGGAGAAGMVLGGQELGLDGSAGREALLARLAERYRREAGARLERGEDAPLTVREVSMSELLLGSSFHMASAGDAGASPGRWSVWGRGARSSFSGKEGVLTLEGDVTTAALGADYERARWLVGVALARSSGDGSYKADGAGDAGELESTLTGVYPYARYRLSGSFSLWGVVGLGSGGMTLTPGGASPVDADLDMGMAAGGARGVLLPARAPGGFELALRADVLVTDTRSDAAAGLAETETGTSRVRLALEGSRSLRFGDAVLTPSVEIGFRNDSGDAETGGGVEAGGSVRWTSGALTTEVRARGLISHNEGGYEEWGVSASVAYAPGSGGRGLTLRAGSSWGASAGGAERLWSQAAGLAPAGAFEPGAAGFEAEAAWGLDAPRGLLTPYTGVAVSGNGETWRAGARWKPGAATEVSLEASLTEQAGGGRPEGGLLLKGSKRW